MPPVGWGYGGTPYNGLYGDAPPEKGTFLRQEVYERVGISRSIGKDLDLRAEHPRTKLC